MIKIYPSIENSAYYQTFCPLPYTKIILNSWGEVSMCCHQLSQLGKLDDNTSILDLWNSKLAQDIRNKTNEGKLHPVCTSWNSCPFIVDDRTPYSFLMYRRYAYPTHLEICLPDKHCNVGGETPDEKNPACIMCRRNFHKPDQPDLTEFLCKKAKPLMPHLINLCVLGIAEPFWKDAVFGVFKNLEFHRYKEQIEFTTNTNGICINEKIAKKFFESTIKSNISWSIDSATPETHIKIRRLDSFDLVIANLMRWIELRKQYGGAEAHKVSIYNSINMLNVNEMTNMVELSHKIGVDKMIMLPTHDQAGTVQLSEIILNHKNIKIFKENSEKAMEKAKELGVNLLYTKRFDVIPPPVQSSAEIANLEEELDLVQLKLPIKKELDLVQLQLPIKKELLGIHKNLRKIP
jgi:hypothetical protein